MKKDKVSVIITTKNEANNLPVLLKSLKMQKYPTLEIIVVDNNSQDNTKAIARKFTKFVFNFGPERSAQRNFGAKQSTGKYLIFLDADMELTSGVVSDVVETANKLDLKVMTIPEKTVGDGFIQNVRKFEREMYMGEPDYEVPRFFEKKAFNEFKGYDTDLTGPEDYDLPYRMRVKYKSGRSNRYILHHEESLTLSNLLRKKYYYASKGARYASKHPNLVWIQGSILFRKVYFKNWRKFVRKPLLGFSFIAVRILESVWSLAGFISSVGLTGFVKILAKR